MQATKHTRLIVIIYYAIPNKLQQQHTNLNWTLIRKIDLVLGIPLVYLLSFYRTLFPGTPVVKAAPAPTKILFVKFWGIGNLFMMLPSAYALRKSFPSARIDLLTLETNKEATGTLSAFNNTYTIDTKSALAFIKTCMVNYRTLLNNDYDLIIDFEQFARFSAIFCSFIGRKKTVGFNTEGRHRHLLYSDSVTYCNTIHITKSFYSLIAQAGAIESEYTQALNATSEKMRSGDRKNILKELSIPLSGIVIVMHIGTSANFSERRWPVDYFAMLINMLTENFNVMIVCTGLKDEVMIAGHVMEQVRDRDKVINATGKLTFRQYLDLILASVLVVSADTSAVHIASAAGIPVIGLYGPNTPCLYGPWGKGGISFYSSLPCSPCITNFNDKIHTCRHPEGKGECMKRTKPEEVFEKIKDCLFDSNTHKDHEETGKGPQCSV